VPPLVKVDEDLSEEVADVFTVAGYEAITVRAQGWGGLLDDELWPRVQAERRWLVPLTRHLVIYASLCLTRTQGSLSSELMKKTAAAIYGSPSTSCEPSRFRISPEPSSWSRRKESAFAIECLNRKKLVQKVQVLG